MTQTANTVPGSNSDGTDTLVDDSGTVKPGNSQMDQSSDTDANQLGQGGTKQADSDESDPPADANVKQQDQGNSDGTGQLGQGDPPAGDTTMN